MKRRSCCDLVTATVLEIRHFRFLLDKQIQPSARNESWDWLQRTQQERKAAFEGAFENCAALSRRREAFSFQILIRPLY